MDWLEVSIRFFLLITVCQLSVLQCHPYLFSPEKNGDLFWSSLSLLFISLVHSSVTHYFWHVAMVQKKLPLLLWGPLSVRAPVLPNMLNMPKSAAAEQYLETAEMVRSS